MRRATRSTPTVVLPPTVVAVVAFAGVVAFAVGACGSGPPAGSPAGSAPGSPSAASSGTTGPAGASSVPGAVDPAARDEEPHADAIASGGAPVVVPPYEGTRRHSGFDGTSAAMQQRVGSAGGSGYVLVVRDGTVLHEEGFGGMTRRTAVPVASTAKLLTAILVLTLVDDGELALDDPLWRWIPSFGDGDERKITIRQMLTHTSGIRDQPCLWNTGGSMAACVEQLAASPLQFVPGTAFSYGNASFHVAGRLVEVITGTDFVTAFRERVGERLGLLDAVWPGAGANPSPAAGVMVSVEDVARVLAMLEAEGRFGHEQILARESVQTLRTDQVADHDTSHDYSVGITRIPRYGLGLWVDAVDDQHRTVVFSGNGANGEYPWIDLANGTYGIVAVNDQRGAELAVPASRVVVDAALADTARTS